MKLYHGTSSAVAKIAMTEGLQPRGETPSNWDEFPSRPDCVYLTSVLAGHFALAHLEPAILEVDTTHLDLNRMLPDEDFVEQASRLNTAKRLRPRDRKRGMAGRTESIRQNLEEYAGRWDLNGESMQGWEASLKGLGTCAYRGAIPAAAITRVVYLKDRLHPIIEVLMQGQPQIGYFQRYQEKLRKAMKWLFGEGTTRDWLGYDVLSFKTQKGFPVWVSDTQRMSA